MFNVSLYPAQHERFEDHVEARQLVLIQPSLLLRMALNVAGEPLIELIVGVKHGGHDEMEEGP